MQAFLQGKHTSDDCEDGYVFMPDRAAVIDGSTSKTSTRINPAMKNGRLAMQLIASYVRSCDASLTCREFCQGVTAALATHYAPGTDYARHPELRLTASAIVCSAYRREVWMIGDCQCIINGRLYHNDKPSEAVRAGQRAELIRQALAAGATVEQLLHNDTARQQIVPGIVADMQQGQNRTYAVIDGFPVFMPGVRIIQLPDTPVVDVVLASDGYPELCPTLQQSEQRLARLLRADPLCYTLHKATKGLRPGNSSFDDRCFLKFQVVGQQLR